jgi:hypothetical protein
LHFHCVWKVKAINGHVVDDNTSGSTFRDSQTGRLIDHVIWTDQECATAAAQKIGQDQKLAPVMADMSESDVIFGHFTQIS